MKSVIVIAAVAAAATALFASPAASYAQSSQPPLTRAQVRQELLDLESVGYDAAEAGGDNYPGDIAAAQERLAAKRAAERQPAEAAYGSNGAPRAESGAPAVTGKP